MDMINFGIYSHNRWKSIARIEVLFWRLFVWSLKTMKISRVFLISGSLLSVSLVIITIFILSARRIYPVVSHQAPINLSSGQRNTLLVIVSEREIVKPQLRSIWLLLELPEKHSFTLIPLYPAAVKNHTVHDQELEMLFAIKNNNNLDESFISHLTELNIWWDDFILIDDFILGSLFEMTNGSSVAGFPVTGADIRTGKYPLVESKPDQLQVQVEFLQYFCQKITVAPLHPNFHDMVASFPSHALTSLNQNDLMDRFTFFDPTSNAVDCDFPTLNATNDTENLQDLY